MTPWILILFAHVGPFAEGNSNALTTAQFNSQQTCIEAGNAAKRMAINTVKIVEFVCVKQ